MKKALLFAKRNLTEMIRDPLLYIFCGGFPIAMMAMFQIILKYTANPPAVFEVTSLVPGLMMFSYSLLMLMSALLISKDKTSAFLKRLFTSPMKGYSFIIGYFIPFIIVGLFQSILCVILGYIFGVISCIGFVSFGRSMLLILEMTPIMIFNIMLGIAFGSLMNDKSAPAITSIFISSSGVLGGAWMPIDSMGGFEQFCGYLPFYPSVYLGRVITNANRTLGGTYQFGTIGIHYIGIISIYLLTSVFLALILFNRTMKTE